ncbi:hypothetical protein F9B85_14000 [Heliorestis acidaminivorans]|uniref:Recombinase domain-containing protein n=1 Tax=Heliorestis acidaminivorans TaxID=553427 RepID=A0A6I0EX60_9FIRM|nr:recombinase family protein [Heliorestis acidaminivorans]KAB2950713.1 hypothetical protein F9B85_14000 [Heliorestis acidaminivorans]
MTQKARQGEWVGGIPPLGYDLCDKKLVINEEEKKIVDFIFEKYLDKNGYLTIVDMLKEKGYKSKTYTTKKGKVRQGRDFSANSVKEILKNPTYIGKIRWGYREDWGKKEENGGRKRKYSEKPIFVEGKHKAIIDEDDFYKVQDMIENNPRSHVKRFNGNHLLSGLLRCPVCEYGMSYQPVV